MPVRFKIREGSANQRVIANLQKMPSAVERAVVAELNRIALDVLNDSKTVPPIVPVDTGALQATGHVEPARVGDEVLRAEVSYGGFAQGFGDVDYAVFVHEAPATTHFERPGAGPKFLEAHVERRAAEIPERLRKAIQDAVS